MLIIFFFLVAHTVLISEIRIKVSFGSSECLYVGFSPKMY